MEAEVTEAVGAGPYERTDKRITSRNGFRDREWDNRVATIELAIPKLRQGSYFPCSALSGAYREPHWARELLEPSLFGVRKHTLRST